MNIKSTNLNNDSQVYYEDAADEVEYVYDLVQADGVEVGYDLVQADKAEVG